MHTTGNPFISSAIVSSLRLLGNVAGALALAAGMGKKPLLASTAIFMGLAALSLFFIGAGDAEKPVWMKGIAVPEYVSVVLLALFMLAYGFGPGTIPWTLLGELVPPSVSPLTTSISVSASLLSLTVLSTAHPFMAAAFGTSSTFAGYGMLSLLMASIAIFFLPETNGIPRDIVLSHFKKP